MSLARTSLIVLLATIAGAAPYQQAGDDWLWLGPDGSALPFESAAEAQEFLRSATVISSEEIPGTQNRPLRMVLERDGVRARAIFRRVDITWRREWIRGKFYVNLRDDARSEYAAYVVADLLGFENIPPTVLRQIDGEDGSLQLWIEDAVPHSELLERGDGVPAPGRFVGQLLSVRLFDNLIRNEDRHPGNLLLGPGGELWMIDHTMSFQFDDELLEREQLLTIDGALWERLRSVPDEAFEEGLAGVIEEGRIEALLERRRTLVEHFEELIASEGAAQVIRSREPGAGRAGAARRGSVSPRLSARWSPGARYSAGLRKTISIRSVS